MRDIEQDNEPLSFVTIGAATLNVIRFLEIEIDKQKKDGDRSDSRDGEADKQREKYISRRIRDIDTFEERARGNDRTGRKRKF